MLGRSETVVARWGPKHPRLAAFASRTAEAVLGRVFARCHIHRLPSRVGQAQLAQLRHAIRDGREAYVLGIASGVHNAGASLVRVTTHGTLELICNEEEERYAAVKHCADYPHHSIEAVARRMRALGIAPADLAACVSSWDSAAIASMGTLRPLLEEAPASLALVRAQRSGEVISSDMDALVRFPARLARQLGLERPLPVIGMRHHDNHAYFSYAVSPFAADGGPAMAIVADATGDDASLSLYGCEQGRLTLLGKQGRTPLDSLGGAYSFLSSTQGGWPMLSSEGRYMGAAAWGDGNRLTNAYYRRLKHLFHFGADGHVRLNRTLAEWTRHSFDRPYSRELIEILGEPIALDDMWNPDAVLNVEDVRHPEVTRERMDKAAAVQMVFEDAMVHIVEHLIRTTGGHRLVLTGGAALNCVANMRLLECFDERWYERHLGLEGTRLHIWVPPTPGDAGTPAGAAYAFAMQAGARPGAPLRHAFYCGLPPTGAELEAAIAQEPAAAAMELGDCADPERREQVADLLAYLLAGGAVMGIYQGAAETGPRALGHRSILANPCNPDTRRLLNERVKFRELVRPLAPMVTRAAAERLFHLEQGAGEDDYNAYNYMVLTARARPQALELIPAVVHHDGTGRLQIVRPEHDPFCHAFLVAMGRRVGVEASVNTSLNVGAPIAQTPAQAIATLERARGMDGLLTIDAEQQARLVWLDDRAEIRERLLSAVRAWGRETGRELPELAAAVAG